MPMLRSNCQIACQYPTCSIQTKLELYGFKGFCRNFLRAQGNGDKTGMPAKRGLQYNTRFTYILAASLQYGLLALYSLS